MPIIYIYICIYIYIYTYIIGISFLNHCVDINIYIVSTNSHKDFFFLFHSRLYCDFFFKVHRIMFYFCFLTRARSNHMADVRFKN